MDSRDVPKYYARWIMYNCVTPIEEIEFLVSKVDIPTFNEIKELCITHKKFTSK